MTQYRPKRANKRWLEDAPGYVLSCHDNGGKTADRYTVFFGGPFWEPGMGRTVQGLGMSNKPTHPQGVSIWIESPADSRDASGKKVRWLDLPEIIQKHVIARCKQE